MLPGHPESAEALTTLGMRAGYFMDSPDASGKELVSFAPWALITEEIMQAHASQHRLCLHNVCIPAVL